LYFLSLNGVVFSIWAIKDMKNSSKTISGLDIQREYVSVAQYSHDENAVLLVAIQPVSIIAGGDLGEQIFDDLKELRGKFKFTSPEIVCSIPSEYAVIKNLQVDNEDQNPKDSLEWELSQQVIGSIDEYVFDFQKTEIRTGTQKSFLAVAYRKDIVHSISSTIKKIRLNPIVVDLDIFALINVFEANYPEKQKLPTVIIHSENDKTKLILTLNGDFIDYECFEHETGSLDPSTFTEKNRSELDKLLSLNYSVLENNPVSIYFTGSLYAQQQFCDAIVEKLGNGELLDPFRKIGCRVGIDEEQLKTYKSQLAVAVGLAYRGNA
jgi:Tfp pilus assembly PilM family ATPase